MTFEQLVGDAPRCVDDYEPSPDLFAKVQRSIEERTHRRRVFGAVAAAAGLLAIGIVWSLAFLDVEKGTVALPWWSLRISSR